MADNKRKTLKTLLGIGAVSALPTSWKKPIVEMVVLPAHAETSPIEPEPEPTPVCSDANLSVSSSGPVITESTSGLATEITAVNLALVNVSYTVVSTFTLSTSSHAFVPKSAGEKETLSVDVIYNGSVLCTHQTTVTWA